MKAWKHFKTITHHKWLVLLGCFRVGLYRQGITHDLSKYSPTEFLIGIRLVFSPLRVSRMVLGVCGAVMVICGIINLVSRYRAVRYIPEYDGIIDADQ